jgi:hypothetical protein
MNRRKWFMGLGALAAGATAASAATKTNAPSKSATYTVPKGITRIRVRSWEGQEEVLDTHFSVKPGQIFRIDAV